MTQLWSCFLMSVPEWVSCWAGRPWRGQGTCMCRVLCLVLWSLPCCLQQLITDENVAAGYTLCFNVWMPCCCSKGCVLPFCLSAHSLGAAHKISLTLSLLTHHTTSPEVRYRHVNARENFQFQSLLKKKKGRKGQEICGFNWILLSWIAGNVIYFWV